jgi:hypothetical protein
LGRYYTNDMSFKEKNLLGVILVLLPVSLLTLVLLFRFSTDGSIREDDNHRVYASQLVITPTQTVALPTIFRDSKTGTVLSIQLVSGRSDSGHFEFLVPQQGYYSGIIPLQQSGKQIVHPQGSVSSQFFPQAGGTTSQTTVRMEGEINTDQNKAVINVFVNGNHYILTTAQADAVEAAKVVKQSLNYTITQNWPALYNLLSSDIKATTSLTQFSQSIANPSSPRIIGADLNGQGQMKTNSGYTYFMQPVTLTVRQSKGSTAIYHDNEYFVLENGNWRFLSTDTPKP